MTHLSFLVIAWLLIFSSIAVADNLRLTPHISRTDLRNNVLPAQAVEVVIADWDRVRKVRLSILERLETQLVFESIKYINLAETVETEMGQANPFTDFYNLIALNIEAGKLYGLPLEKLRQLHADDSPYSDFLRTIRQNAANFETEIGRAAGNTFVRATLTSSYESWSVEQVLSRKSETVTFNWESEEEADEIGFSTATTAVSIYDYVSADFSFWLLRYPLLFVSVQPGREHSVEKSFPVLRTFEMDWEGDLDVISAGPDNVPLHALRDWKILRFMLNGSRGTNGFTLTTNVWPFRFSNRPQLNGNHLELRGRRPLRTPAIQCVEAIQSKLL